jgi:hypothetical protein
MARFYASAAMVVVLLCSPAGAADHWAYPTLARLVEIGLADGIIDEDGDCRPAMSQHDFAVAGVVAPDTDPVSAGA